MVLELRQKIQPLSPFLKMVWIVLGCCAQGFTQVSVSGGGGAHTAESGDVTRSRLCLGRAVCVPARPNPALGPRSLQPSSLSCSGNWLSGLWGLQKRPLVLLLTAHVVAVSFTFLCGRARQARDGPQCRWSLSDTVSVRGSGKAGGAHGR